jgi:hypothetical protein
MDMRVIACASSFLPLFFEVALAVYLRCYLACHPKPEMKMGLRTEGRGLRVVDPTLIVLLAPPIFSSIVL